MYYDNKMTNEDKSKIIGQIGHIKHSCFPVHKAEESTYLIQNQQKDDTLCDT